MQKKIIGQFIKDEVEKQKIKVVDFAEMLYCSTNNIYKIYNKANLDIGLLAQISKVLKHDFFEDISNGTINMENPEILKDFNNKKAVSQFMDVVPGILEELNRQPIISFGRPLGLEKDIKIPDYILNEYFITFTIGETYMEQFPTHCNSPLIEYSVVKNDDVEIEILINRLTIQTQPHLNPVQINIKLDYKTKEDWEKTLKYAFYLYEYYKRFYRVRL